MLSGMSHPRASLCLSAVLCSLLLAACSDGGDTPPRRTHTDGGPIGTDAGLPPLDFGPPIDLGPAADFGPPRPGDSDDDGVPDAAELAAGTDPNNADTDGDGYSDGVEMLAGTDPLSAASFIPPTDFYVVLPYAAAAELRELDFTARLGKGDVFFLVDTTGSMGIAIINVRTSLSTVIVPALSAAIADVVMGVGDFRDFPVAPYGETTDFSYVTRQTMTADVPTVQTALNGLVAGGGNDEAEAQLEGLYGAVSGSCATGSGFGGACFRTDSYPIIVVVTDAPAHNGRASSNPYSGVSAVSWATTTAALNANSVKVVGAAVPIIFFNNARPDLEALATDTGSLSSSGALTVYDAPGGSVSTSVVDGVMALVGAAQQDVTSRNLDDPSDAVDATAFIKAVRPLRATRATSFDTTTFYGVSGGTTITFQVTFQNDFLPEQSYVQIFRAQIEVLDVPGGTRLDIRNVYIVVPGIGGVLI
jgi:hypothetical protein